MNQGLTRWLYRCVLLIGILFALPASAVNPSDLLPPAKAFAAQVERNGNQLTLTLNVADGYYVYRDRIQLTTVPPGLLQPAVFPAGHVKNDPYFGKQVILQQHNQIRIPLTPGAPQRFTLNFKLQGCAAVGVCYPPYTHKLQIGNSGYTAANWATHGTSDTGRVAAPLALFTFFLAGIGMAFTACMYPLLPILSALIAGQGVQLSRRRGLLLSLAYVQGLALCYTIVGVIAGLTGSLLTVWLQQPVVVLSASLLLVLFALSMFELYSLQLPSALQSRLAVQSNRLSGGRVLTVFAMGVLSALMIGPCVAPPLALALGYIGASGDALFGGLALYLMALGLGVPLILVGTFGGHFLPRAGRWMKAVKSAFGVLMLGLAIQMASPFIPALFCLLAWAALALGSAVFLRAFDALPTNAPAIARLGKALGLLLFLLGAAELVGALAGAKNPAMPLSWGAPTETSRSLPAFQPVLDNATLDAQLGAARGQAALLDIDADWCVSCKEMDATTWRDARIQQRLQRMTVLRADVTHNTPAQSALLKRFGLFGPPAIILFSPDGQVREQIIGYIDAADLDKKLTALQGIS
jgi:thiol:disulfide interchange protein DsbD